MASSSKKDSEDLDSLIAQIEAQNEKIAKLERAQNVELALEKVRVASMSMQGSKDLRHVVEVLFKQVRSLGLAPHGVDIMMFDRSTTTIDCWFEEITRTVHDNIYKIHGKKNNLVSRMWTCWEAQEEGYSVHLKGAAKTDYDNYLLNESGWSQLPKVVKEEIRSHNEAYFTFSCMKFGLFQIVNLQPVLEEAIEVLDRFASVFEQSYTRFLDLQKAEAQTREAQVEAALEKVRSRSLAMNTTEELEEVVGLVLQKLKELDIENDGEATIFTYDKGARDSTCWLASDLDFSIVRFHYLHEIQILIRKFGKAVIVGKSM